MSQLRPRSHCRTKGRGVRGADSCEMARPSVMLSLLLLWGVLTTLGCVASQPTSVTELPTEATKLHIGEPQTAVVQINAVSYTVDLAVQPEERRQGLSGRVGMEKGSGMLFVFEEERELHFWMKEMNFPLDIIWINAQCQLLEVAAEVPTPPHNASNEEIPRVQSPSPALYVLEVNAGEAARNNLRPGDLVEFRGVIADVYGC